MNRSQPKSEILVQIEAELASRGLGWFTRLAWRVVEPGTPYCDNWHIGLMCEYLEAVLNLEINNLIINIPPRHMKSLLVSVFLPVYSWLRAPETRWLTGSYALPLATRDALKSRRLIQSPWFKERFGDRFNLCGDQNRKARYENDHGGSRLAFSFNSAVTGEGGDVLVVDDPLRAQDADNPAAIQKVNEIFDQAITTRANDPRQVRRIIIMQRLHENDLTGHLLAKMEQGGERYEHLCLPAEYRAGAYTPPANRPAWKDPRSKPAELLWAGRFGERENAAARANLGERAYAGQYAQLPMPIGGTIYLAEWWRGKNRVELSRARSRVGSRYLSWDTALKDGQENDFSSMVVMEVLMNGKAFLREVIWGKWAFPRLAEEIVIQAERWNMDGLLRGIVIEDKASGISALQTLRQSAPGWIAALLAGFSPGLLSKEARARQASLWCERGMLLLPFPAEEAGWLPDFESQLYVFPAGRTKDAVDAFGQAILFLEHLLAGWWRCGLAEDRGAE
ncbi:MAG TPA: hypothetical protein VN226_04010 [Anaerolineales bacterium]|nr:hypothetical protein [Anaerolineales bacterium]